MSRRPTVFDTWGTATQISIMAAEAQAVIATRLLGALGFGSTPPPENARRLTRRGPKRN